MKRIIIVAESINVEDSSGSKANVALIHSLQNAGFTLKVYHYTRKTITLNGIECFSVKELKFNPLYFLSRIQRFIQNKLKFIINKPLENWWGFSFTFLNDSKSIARGLKGVENLNPDIVLTLSKGTSFRPHHALLSIPKLHGKWMAYIHDPYPFHLYPAPYNWSEPGYKQKIKFFGEVADKCKWAGYPSFLLAEWMEGHFKDFRNKRVIIPHQFDQESQNSLLPNWFDESKFNILHAGNLMKQRDPFPLIKAFQKFLITYPEAKNKTQLLLVGHASYHLPELKKIETELDQLFISDGYLAYNEALILQEKASVNVILESNAEISPFLPGKFPHCVASNKVILHLGPEKSEVKRLLGPNYPYWAEANDIEKISLLITNLYIIWKENPNSLKLNREELRNYLSVDYLKQQISNLT